MPLIDMQSLPSDHMRRWFGLSLAAFLLLLSYWLQHLGMAVSMGLACLAMMLAGCYYAFPNSQLKIIRAWQWLTYPLAWTMGHGLLLTVFFGVFLPIGMVLRISGYDPLKLRKGSAKSDWISRKPIQDAARYFKQF